jgi:hypothetical protein
MVVDLIKDENGDLILPIPEELLSQAGWKIGDRLMWSDNMDGTFTLSKRETELVLVEAIHLTKVQYVVEVPVGKSKWALDSVALKEVYEFTSEELGFQISSNRVVTHAEAIAEFRRTSPHSVEELELFTDEEILEQIQYIGE